MLCAIMIFAVAVASVPFQEAEADRTIYDVEAELNRYKALLSELRSELSSVSKDIEDLEHQSGETADSISLYMQEISLLEADIALAEIISDSYDLKRAEVHAKIILATEDYEYRLAMYKNLMQFIYENSTVNSFELLFSSSNFSDFLSRQENFDSIMECANTIIKDLEASLADLESLQSELEVAQAEYDTYLSMLNASKLELDKKVAELEILAAGQGLDYESLKSEYSETNARIKEINKKINELEEERAEMLQNSGGFCWPLASSVSYRVSSHFGYRNDPFTGQKKYHKGLDLACAKNSPILAVQGGTVTRAEYWGSYGNCVVIYHGNGVSSLYAHCNSFASGLKVGSIVKAGDTIAYVGTTGRSTGYHLHFGVLLNGDYVNPDEYLPDGYYKK